MTFAIIQLFLLQIILPAFLLFFLWKGTFHSKLQWLIEVLAVSMYMIWTVLTGRWDWLGYYLRFLWVVLPILFFYLSWKKTQSLPYFTPLTKEQKWSFAIHLFILLIFGSYNVMAFSSYTTEDTAIELSFPLQDGKYYVGHGGNHVQMNYHNSYEPQQYALDITKLNDLGLRTAGLYPKELESYAIYEDTLYSPCDGKIIEARDGLPDQTPPHSDPDHPKGNYAALRCEGTDATVYIAHMQNGSVAMEKESHVTQGEPIGRVGNSGNTSEPHLHIHAELDGTGVPIHFDGKFLVRNSIVSR
ncbi:M23 family metallopeptidase [Alteribacillus iranensis]|uniref:Peptidase family M23 n=1 Tax=Alteribacillus iranensis TaxID=930128 RepID=A0A1I2D1L1_9BACI|nr:M23 family metallopeptidase [Alteribacillus iranensis]SFE74411.1 Peptidase family M23 [Alteribacillus iranensis]